MPHLRGPGGARCERDGTWTMVRQRGTYRALDGSLVHCVVRGDEIEIEVEQGSPAHLSRLERDLVKLSDDPDWPDGWDRNHGVAWPTD